MLSQIFFVFSTLVVITGASPIVINDPLENYKLQETRSLGIRAKRQALRDHSYPLSLWNDGPIPFTISTPHAVTIILKSIKFWQQNTCIDFEQNGKGKNVLDFVRGTGCYSAIGRVWFQKRQDLSVGTICEHFHTVTHELAHALGLFHTQSRPDRNRYVIIHEENALASFASTSLNNFVTLITEEGRRCAFQRGQQGNFRAEDPTSCVTYDIPYEYGSVMHYRNHEFSVNSKPTVVPRDPLHEHTMGSGTGPSFLDVLLINKHYNCLDRCATVNTDCKNGGYPHPRNCDECICPSGFAGRYCNEKQSSDGCGEILYANSTVLEVFHRMGAPGTRDDMSYCYWWIKTLENERIEVRIISLNTACWEGCLFGGLEIKASEDKRLTGYRFCCDEFPKKPIVIPGGILPIILFNRDSFTSFSLQYRSVPSDYPAAESQLTNFLGDDS
ncbi:unnamed protein product [Enterobius vermicularis]|uniref:Zinc metalloproteinase n=1 Tax=Enterobius vermicularis TaxID=51028 RepID=A0A0N4UUV3_ENTVE|nr:unnamed protein product [Enterobius vermicularis]